MTTTFPKLNASNELLQPPNGKVSTIISEKFKYKSIQPSSKEIDSYGCGDCFAGAVTAALSAKLNLDQAIKIGAYCGAECATHYGPY